MDIPTILQDDYDPYFQRELNDTMVQGMTNGYAFRPLTDTQIATLAQWETQPPLPEGFMMYDATNIQMRIVTVAANAATMTDATLGTIAII